MNQKNNQQNQKTIEETSKQLTKNEVINMEQMKKRFLKFAEKHAEIWKFIKFSFTGASTSVLEMAVFAFLQYVIFKSLNQTPVTDNAVLAFLGIEYKGYLYSYAISAIIGYAAAYVMNRKLTFKADANPVLSTIIYAIMVACTIAFNTWFGAFLGTWIKNNGWDSVFIEMVTKLVVMTVPTLWTYPMNRFVIHRKKKTQNEQTEAVNDAILQQAS
ncbi:MAG: GtrA family protein [Eubacterium sp.]|jgi:putative flippase GtrA